MKRIIAAFLVAGTVFCCGCEKQQKPSAPPAITLPDNPLVQGITAITVGEHKLSRTELNYFYIDTIQKYCDENRANQSHFPITSKPLNEQFYNQDTGETWADAFLDMTVDSVKHTYALYDAAITAGHKLSADEKQTAKNLYNRLENIAVQKHFPTFNAYLKALYGFGSSETSFQAYCDVVNLAESYRAKCIADIKASYDSATLREYENGKEFTYNAFNYVTLFLPAGDFATDEAAESAAKKLAVSRNSTKEKLDKACRRLHPDGQQAATEHSKIPYLRIPADLQEWLRSDVRKTGEVTYLKSTLPDDPGYYIVIFRGINDNTFQLPNVRHILIPFEGGTPDEQGMITYSEEEKLVASQQAQEILNLWNSGEKTEAGFAALAQEYSADSNSSAKGGLHELVTPDQMVVPLSDWCFDPQRKATDTGIIETEEGFHVMFYCGLSAVNYRDHQIITEKLEKDVPIWENSIYNTIEVTRIDTSGVAADLIIDKLDM